MTQTQTNVSQPDAGDDPLAHLHKMSTTAGLGSGDYVAVNGAAVFALILGFASALILFEDYLLIIPIACIVVSVMAWIQIKNSNGTQTGKSLIVIALLAAVGLGGGIGAKRAIDWQATRDDRAAIAKLIEDLGEDVKAGNYDSAYARFSSRFRGRMTREQFEVPVKFWHHSELYGSLKRFKWNGLIAFEKDESTGSLFAVAPIEFEVEKGNADRSLMDNVTFRKEGDKWEIDNYPLLSPPPPPAPPGQRPQK